MLMLMLMVTRMHTEHTAYIAKVFGRYISPYHKLQRYVCDFLFYFSLFLPLYLKNILCTHLNLLFPIFEVMIFFSFEIYHINKKKTRERKKLNDTREMKKKRRRKIRQRKNYTLKVANARYSQFLWFYEFCSLCCFFTTKLDKRVYTLRREKN